LSAGSLKPLDEPLPPGSVARALTVLECAASETSSVSQEETLDVSNEAVQPKVEATQLLADLRTLSGDSFEGRNRVRRATRGARLHSSGVREARSPTLRQLVYSALLLFLEGGQ
jgi:hypothetical protein